MTWFYFDDQICLIIDVVITRNSFQKQVVWHSHCRALSIQRTPLSCIGPWYLLFWGLNYVVEGSRWKLLCQQGGDRISCLFHHLENADPRNSDGLALVWRANDEYMSTWTSCENLLLEPNVFTKFYPPDKLPILWVNVVLALRNIHTDNAFGLYDIRFICLSMDLLLQIVYEFISLIIILLSLWKPV